MKKLLKLLLGSSLLLAASSVVAQAPGGEQNCPATTAIPPQVGSGTTIFSPNQTLCLPELAPIGGSLGPLAFIVQGVEPGDRVDSQGTIFVVSIRGVPAGIDLWRWFQTTDGPPNPDNTLPFKYEGQPDNCGIFFNTGCANNVGSLSNLGVAPGGGDADIAVNSATLPNIPNLAVSSLTLPPGVTATHSTDRGNPYTPPNVAAALIPGDDRQWQDAIDASTVYLEFHDVATFNIDIQRSNDGGVTYVNGVCEAIDPPTFLTAGTLVGSANVAGQTRIDKSTCPTQANPHPAFA